MHARFCFPVTGRFLSVDPVGGNPRAPQSWNRYAYVLGNPMKYTDPFGLKACGANGELDCETEFDDEITVTAKEPGPRSNPFGPVLIVVRGRPSVSSKGVDFIARFEGFKSNLYQDPAGHCTVGFGHLINRGACANSASNLFGQGLTRSEGIGLLRQDVNVIVNPALGLVRVPLAQNQVDALGSFVFNLGGSAFRRSTLLKKLNEGSYEAVPGEISRWVFAGGRVLKGLEVRRGAEARLFAIGDYGD